MVTLKTGANGWVSHSTIRCHRPASGGSHQLIPTALLDGHFESRRCENPAGSAAAATPPIHVSEMFAIDEATIEAIHRALTKAARYPPSPSCAGTSR
jgi:hypothetical protein